MFKKSLILNVILNINFETANQKMVTSIDAFNTEHNKIQQSHLWMCYLIKIFWILWITTKRKWQNEKDTKKKDWIGKDFKDNSNV